MAQNPAHLAVIGAGGRTGAEVVRQALRRGHPVTAVLRRPRPDAERPGLRQVAADVTDAEAVSAALAGVDAVVSTLGIGSSRQPTTTYSDGVTNLLAGMAEHDIGRIVVISASPAGSRAEQTLVNRLVVMPLLERIYGASYADMRRMEDVLQSSRSDWIALRPPRLVTGPPLGAYRVDSRPLAGSRSITIADLATALLDEVADPGLHRRGVYVSN